MKPERSTDLLLYSVDSSSGAALAVPDGKSNRRMLPGLAARHKSVFTPAIALLAVLPAFSQTTINLGTQGRNVDFSSQSFTRPISVGTALPSTCQVGQLFFNSAAAAGSNLYGCTALNVWTALAAAASSGSAGSSGTGSGIGSPSPNTVNFGSQTVATTSPAQPVVLTNTGTGPLTITGITLSGSNAADFNQGNNCGTSLAANASCTIALTFTPSTTASESATLNITDNGTGSPHTVSLSGTGAAAAYSSGPSITPAAPSTSVGKAITLTSASNVTWALASGSVGTLTGSGTTATYTAPATLTAPTSYSGCMLAPSDSVFNTRIDNLPVNSQSANWMNSFIAGIQFSPSWGTNLTDNTTPSTALFFHYTGTYNGNYQIATGNNRMREAGALPIDSANDHHLLEMNRQTCQFTETYQDGLPVQGCSACNAASGYQYSGTTYALPTQGTTDAAGLPLARLSLRLADIRAGVVTHALRFTLCTGCINSAYYLWPATQPNGSQTPNAPPMGARFRLKKSIVVTGVTAINVTSGGSGYTSAPTVTIAGCQVAPTATALVSSGVLSSVVLSNPGTNCVSPTISFGGPGSGAAATLSTWSPVAQIILTGLQNYGMFLADNGGSGQIQTDTDLLQDPSIMSALTEIANARLAASAFEAVDESSLMMSANSGQVNPNNGYVTPPAYAVVTATDSQGNKTTLPIAVLPVLVGVPYPKMTMEAGMSGYQMQSWVNNSTNQSVVWSITSGPGSITSGGVYTPPTAVATPTSVVLKATAAADSAASTTVVLTVIPAGTNPANAIRIDVGNTSSYTDTQGNLWLPDTLGWESGAYSVQNDSYPTNAWNNIPDQALYQTYYYTWGDDIIYGPFIVPNGNYKIGFSIAQGNCSGTFDETAVFDNGLTNGPVDLEANGVIELHFDLAKQVNNACRVPYTAYIPATVSNNLLFAAVRATGGASTQSITKLNALAILPDSTAPYLTVDTNYANGMAADTTAQMYAVGWYMSNAVTWSVTGGGSIDQTGLYTAPATLSASTTVTITATSTANPSVSVSVPLTVIP